MTGETGSRAKILGLIRDILADVLDNDLLDLTEETRADMVPGWDSINHVKLLIAIESELGFRFGVEEVNGLDNVGQLVDVVDKRIKVA